MTAACTATLLCSSFEGTERLYYLWRDGGPLDSLRMQNIDAMTRWIYRSLPVDGLHRVLWYQPHHATGYALGLSAMLVIVQARRPEKARVFALSGTLLAFCLMLSTFSVIMLSAVASLVALIVLVPRRAWRALLPAAIAAAIPLALATAAAMALGYVDRDSSGLVRVLVNPMAVTEPVWAIFLSFGPLLLLSIVGAVLAAWHRATELLTVARDHRRVVRVLLLRRPARPPVRLRRLACRAPAVRGVHRADGVRAAGNRPRDGCAAAQRRRRFSSCSPLSAAPTFAIDLYNTQDTDNRAPAPGGLPLDAVLDRDELEALAWIRALDAAGRRSCRSTDVAARCLPWAYIPAFAERRMAAGLPISMVPLEKYETASREVKTVFTAAAG